MSAMRVPEYLEGLRDALMRAHRTRTPVDAAALPVPNDDADAYAVQRALAARLAMEADGEPVRLFAHPLNELQHRRRVRQAQRRLKAGQ